MTLLHIDSSARQSSTSRRLTTHFVEAWRSVSDELIDELFAADVIVIGASIVRRAGQATCGRRAPPPERLLRP